MAGSAALLRLITALAAPLPPSQAPAQATVEPDRRLVREAHTAAVRLVRAAADSFWPGFRPDTLPILYVLPGQGTLLLGWSGPLPAEFSLLPDGHAAWKAASDRGAASTATTLGGRATAQVVVRNEDLAALIGLTLHEAFHVHAAAARSGQRRFGRGENSFLVSTYPVFDAENEAGVALEGLLLAEALETPDSERRRELARAFIAVRESRHRRLGAELAEFEQQAELNEGLAEYQLVRSAELGAKWRMHPDSGGAERIMSRLPQHLRTLTEDVRQSLRLRFYRLGPAQALLLDRLEGQPWKTRLLERNLTLQDALADAAGARDAERAILARVASEFDAGGLKRSADVGVETLKSLRQRQVDSLLSAPGLRITIALDSMPGRTVGLCGIDPQNLLQVDPDRLVHTRWVRLCSGTALDATFNTPAVQDNRGRTWQAVLQPGDSLRMTVRGTPLVLNPSGHRETVNDLQLESAGLELRAARAELRQEERSLLIRIKP